MAVTGKKFQIMSGTPRAAPSRAGQFKAIGFPNQSDVRFGSDSSGKPVRGVRCRSFSIYAKVIDAELVR
jgi:hypothetical protein